MSGFNAGGNLMSQQLWFLQNNTFVPVSITNPFPVTIDSTASNNYTYHPADNATVSTASTAVVVFAAGEINNGAVITNDLGNTATLIVNAITTAATAEGGTNFALAPGDSFVFGTNTGSITANSTIAMPFSAMRW
jgi:hypothetical protein